MALGPNLYFLDSNVFLTGFGPDAVLREGVGRFLASLRAAGGMTAASIMVLEEVFHVSWRLTGHRATATDRTESAADSLTFVYPVDQHDYRRAMRLAHEVDLTHRSTRDYYHAAVMLNHGIRHIVSCDRDFDRFPGIVRLDPALSS